MSTAPYKDTWISPEEEIDRLCRGIEAIRGACSLPISADTQRAAVAAAALDCGALIVNDVSGFRSDPAMAPLVAERGAGAILMANDDPELDDQGRHPVSVVRQLLDEAVDRAILAGVPRGRLMVDPGFGFFRHRSIPWYEFDLRMLQGVPCYRELGLPLLLGVSRKSFFSKMLGEKDAADRLPGSLEVAAWSLIKGIDWLRVHDVRETVDTLRMMRLLTEQGDFSPEE
jgi:dihydropteroate synthase